MSEPVHKVSIVVPIYNEEATLAELVARVLAVRMPTDPASGRPVAREVILVDDGSRDGSSDIARKLSAEHPDVRALICPENHGKGYALRTAFAQVTGDVILIQDADLEYDPQDYPALLAPILSGKADVVYGSRVLGPGPQGTWMFYLGGRVVSLATNLLFGSDITDEPTCYKVFRRSVLDSFELTCTGFEFCPEFTAKALRAASPARAAPSPSRASMRAAGVAFLPTPLMPPPGRGGKETDRPGAKKRTEPGGARRTSARGRSCGD